MKKTYKRAYNRTLIMLLPCVLWWVVADYLASLESYSFIFAVILLLVAVTNVLWTLFTPYVSINGVTVYVNERMVVQRKMAIPDISNIEPLDAKTLLFTSHEGAKMKVKLSGMRAGLSEQFQSEVAERREKLHVS